MKRRTRWASFAAAGAALVFALTACSAGPSVNMNPSASGSASGGAGGGTLVAAISGQPDQLDPAVTTSYNSFQVLENVFDTLVEPDDQLAMKPALAESWTTSSDQLTWTFKLRQGVKWHDGTDFTSADVVYSYNRIIKGKLSPSWRFSSVTSITAPDDSTVVIKVKTPSPNLLANLGGFKGLAIVNKKNVESGDIKTKPVGTGPFSVTSFTSGDSIQLKANPDWWGGAPKLAGVTYKFIPEASTAMAALRAGEVQWTDSVPPQDVASIKSDSSITLGQVGSNDYWYLALNQAKKPWSDVRVRQAIAFALDRDAIAKAAKYGNATVNQLAIPKSSQWYVEYAPYTLDENKAKSLLAEAGVTKADMTFLATSDYPETVTIGQVLADVLGKLGITVKIKTVDFATWLDEQGKGNFDMLMMGWLGNIDPDDFYYGQHHTDGSNNYQHFSNPEVDKLLDAGRIELDEAKRKDDYAQAAKIIADQCSYIYLYNPDVLQVWSPKLQGYTARSDRAIRFRTASLG